MRTSDYDYALPPELVATEPGPRRDACRLLVLRAGNPAPDHRSFAELPSLLRAGDRLVLNDTRVLPARLVGRREPGGGAVELLLLEPADEAGDPWTWSCLAKPARKLRPGVRVLLADGGAVAHVVAEREGGERVVRLEEDSAAPAPGPRTASTFEALLARLGHPPLPPYILAARRQFEGDAAPARPADRDAYQTVFAREGRSVAAPTAGLHFTPGLLARLEAVGVVVERLRLDVGAGTFKPVEAEDPRDHPMHAERWWIEEATATRLNAARAAGARIVAVGTTVVRALESSSAASPGGAIRAGHGATDLMILPGHRWRAVDALVTNFHLPRSTLLMLVAALRDRDTVLAAYAEAVARRYRFYSYGDAMLVER